MISIDDIDQAIFGGSDSIEKALSVIKTYAEKVDKKLQYIRIKDKAKTIPSLVANRIHVSDKLKFYFRSGIPVSGKVKDPKATVSKIAAIAEDDVNKRISSTTEPAVKRNREFEKREILSFFKTNSEALVSLYELYNLMIDFKDECNDPGI